MKIFSKYWRSILCSIVIVILCFIPGDELAQPEFDIPYLDKIVHFCFYFFLSLIIQYEVKNKIRFKHYCFIFIYTMVLGGLIEIVQENFIKERGGDFFDLIADLLGAGFAFMFNFKHLKKSFKIFIFISLIIVVVIFGYQNLDYRIP